ncbi:MAG: acyl-CoA dehydratase activase [Oscillospiraceae bacterium]
MITGGIDMGFAYAKAVVLEDGKLIGKAIGVSGGISRKANAEKVWKEALAQAGVDGVDKLVCTGKGKYDVPFADKVYTEPVCLLEAAKACCEGVTTVMDIGADASTVITVKADGKIGEMVINQKCSAGYGLMLELMADKLELGVEKLGQTNMAAAGDAKVSDGCMVFAEMDALSLLNRGYSAEAVAAALIKSAAVRASVVYDDITIRRDEKVLLTGGVALNAAFVEELSKRKGIRFILPEEPQYALAIGAAIKAAAL